MGRAVRETFVDLETRCNGSRSRTDARRSSGRGQVPVAVRPPCSTDTWTPRAPVASLARAVPGFQPSAFVEDGRLYGLGISNMKGALACVEALRALSDAGVRLHGDVMIAAVAGEIEKNVQRRAGRRVSRLCRRLAPRLHGGVADMCILGDDRVEGRARPLRHALLRISTQGPFIHTAFSEGRRDENSIVTDADSSSTPCSGGSGVEDDPSNTYRGAKAIVNVGAVVRRVRLARVAHATPHRSVPRRARAADEDHDGGALRCSRWCENWNGSPSTASRARCT